MRFPDLIFPIVSLQQRFCKPLQSHMRTHFICSNMTWTNSFFSSTKVPLYWTLFVEENRALFRKCTGGKSMCAWGRERKVSQWGVSHRECSVMVFLVLFHLYLGTFYTCSLYSKLFIFHSHVNLSLRLFECYLHLSVDTYGNRYIYFGG